MPSHNIAALPRTIASVLLDLHYARQDWDQAVEAFYRAGTEQDASAEDAASDRIGEADQRIDELRDEFKALFASATGIAWERVETALDAGLL